MILVNIFIVEDNEHNLYLMNFLLSNARHTLIEVKSGREALEKINHINVDMILLDIQLPDMSGYEVAREFRKMSTLDSVPIVAVTSYAMNGDKERVYLSGCDYYMEKPIDPDSFVKKIEEYHLNGINKS